MWVRGAAIRPVPSFARVHREQLERIERQLAEADRKGTANAPDLDESFVRFEQTQPALARRSAEVLARPLDETALALGYFLTVAVWLAFERAFGSRLREVSSDALEEAQSAITLEEELRANHSHEPLDVEDVLAFEQPGVISFLNTHIETALDPDSSDVDVDDVDLVYRHMLVMTLALSYAVEPTSGTASQPFLA